MKTLLKIFFLLILLIVGGLAGGTYWFGKNLEQDMQQALAQSTSQGGVILKSSSFNPGLLESQAQIMAMVPGVNMTGMIDQRIVPGPIPLANLLSGQVDLATQFQPVKFVSGGTLKLHPKKGLDGDDANLVKKLAAANIDVRSDLVSNKNTITIILPAFKGKMDGVLMSWPQTEFRFETNDRWSPIYLVGGTGTMKLPARMVENLIRLRIHLDIEQLKTNRKLKPAEIKKLSPAAVRISVANALPGYIERYGIRDVLNNARSQNRPITISFRPGQIKVGGVTLPR